MMTTRRLSRVRFFKMTRSIAPVALMLPLFSCSGIGTFQGILGKNPAPNSSAPSGQTGTPQPQENKKFVDEREIPTIEVAGSNLTTTCIDLDSPGRASETRGIHCEIESDSSTESEFKSNKIAIKSATSDRDVEVAAISAFKGTDPQSWRISKGNPVGLHFEVPTAEISDMRKYPVRVSIANLQMNGTSIAESTVFQPRLNAYAVQNQLCESSAVVTREDVTLKFFKNQQDARKAIFWSRPETGNIDPTSVFCGLEFLDDLRFDWPSPSNVLTRRYAATLAREHGVFTNIKPTELTFGLSPLAMIWRFMFRNLSESMSSADQSNIGESQVWCPFGKTDCISVGNSLYHDTIFLSRIDSRLINLNAKFLFEPAISTPELSTPGFRIVIHNYPDDTSSTPVFPTPNNSGIVRVRVKYIPPATP